MKDNKKYILAMIFLVVYCICTAIIWLVIFIAMTIFILVTNTEIYDFFSSCITYQE